MSSGTNIEAGIRKGLEMLAADKEVADSAKHLVLVTDGVTYMWGAPPSTIYNEVNPDNISRIWASPSVCEFYPIGTDSKYIASFQNAAQWLSDQGEALSAVIDEKTCSYDDFDEESDPYLTLEKRPLYLLRCRSLHDRIGLGRSGKAAITAMLMLPGNTKTLIHGHPHLSAALIQSAVFPVRFLRMFPVCSTK